MIPGLFEYFSEKRPTQKVKNFSNFALAISWANLGSTAVQILKFFEVLGINK